MVTARILVITLMCLGFCLGVVFGQDKTDNVPLDLVEAQVSLADVTKWQSMGNGMGMGPGMGSSQTQINASADRQLIFTLKCKNTSAKQTSMIYWESRFTDTKDNVLVKQYKSKKKIKAGKDETIEEPFSCDPKTIPATVKVGFRIYKIEYSDNSTWESSRKENDENAIIYKLYKLQ